MYRLVFLSGKMKGRRIAVQQGTITIGRDPTCHIDLAHDDEVSRNHAAIEQRPDGIYIKDLAAMNRTELNGKQIAGEAKLKHGDKIEIGRTQFEFQDVEDVNVGPGRSLNSVQLITYIAIGAIVIVQLIFVFVLPRLNQGSQVAQPAAAEAAKPEAAEAAPGAEQPADKKATAFEQVVAQLQSSQPPPPAAPPASESSTGSATAVSEEVRQLRQALAELQQQMVDLSQQTATLTNPAESAPGAEVIVTTADIARAAGEVPAATAEAAPAPPAVPADALLQKSKELLSEATGLIAQSRLDEADAVLERVQVLAPEFTPSYVERARLYETRGMLGRSGEQWTRVMEMSVGTPLYEQAAAERQRIARAELMQTMTTESEDEPGGTGGSQQKLARRIRIVGVEREKFDANQEFDEMRLLRINVKPRMSEGEIDPGDFTCTVVFYDRGLFKQVIRPTRAVAPKDALKVDGQWPAGEQRTLTAAYIVPKDFRDEEEKTLGERRTYEGYRVLIYYKGVLQDESALPKTLAALPAPPPPEKTGR